MRISPQFGCQVSQTPQFSGVRRRVDEKDVADPEKGEVRFNLKGHVYIADGEHAKIVEMLKAQSENIPHKTETLISGPEGYPPIQLQVDTGIDMEAYQSLKKTVHTILGRFAASADKAL